MAGFLVGGHGFELGEEASRIEISTDSLFWTSRGNITRLWQHLTGMNRIE